MEERVVTIDFKASVGSEKLDVCGANIVLGINDIPRIELLVPPTKGNASALKPYVSSPKLSDFCSLYQDLAKKAEDQSERGTVNISIATKSTSGSSKVEELSLKNWVLSGVGLSSVSATSAPHLSVILHHPSFFLTKVGSIYLTPKSTAEKVIASEVRDKKSFLEIVKAVYDAYKNSNVVKFYDAPDDMSKTYMESLGANEYDPSKYLRDDTKQKGLFLGKALGKDYLPLIAQAIGAYTCPMGDGSSTWDMIVRSSGTLMLNVVQDKDNNFASGEKGLVLEPIMPWKTKNVVVLPEDRCLWTEVPGMDMFKLVGVMARKLRIFGNKVTTWSNILNVPSKDETGICDILYCPVQPEHADGRIMKTSAPSIMYQAFMAGSSSGENITNGFSAGNNAWLQGFDKALKVYCRAVYESSYGLMNSAKAQMALGLKDPNGNYILPGSTCGLESGGKYIYYGCIRNVVHSLNVKGGCSTMLTMSHVRPTLKIDRIPNGDINAAYDLANTEAQKK